MIASTCSDSWCNISDPFALVDITSITWMLSQVSFLVYDDGLVWTYGSVCLERFGTVWNHFCSKQWWPACAKQCGVCGIQFQTRPRCVCLFASSASVTEHRRTMTTFRRCSRCVDQRLGSAENSKNHCPAFLQHCTVSVLVRCCSALPKIWKRPTSHEQQVRMPLV